MGGNHGKHGRHGKIPLRLRMKYNHERHEKNETWGDLRGWNHGRHGRHGKEIAPRDSRNLGANYVEV